MTLPTPQAVEEAIERLKQIREVMPDTPSEPKSLNFNRLDAQIATLSATEWMPFRGTLDLAIAVLESLPSLRQKAEACDALVGLLHRDDCYQVELTFFDDKFFVSVSAIDGGSETSGPEYLITDIESETLTEAILAAASQLPRPK